MHFVLAEDFDYVRPPPPDLAAPGKPILFAMAESLALPSSIKDRAYALYKDALNMKSVANCNPNAVKAACLYLACKRGKRGEQPRTLNLKEMEAVAGCSTEDEIGRAVDGITFGLTPPPFIPVALLWPYCSKLGMSRQAADAAFEAIRKAEIPEGAKSGRRRYGVLAAAIYLISLVSPREEDKKSLSDVSRVTKEPEETIAECLDILRPQAARVVPEWYCKPEDVKVQ